MGTTGSAGVVLVGGRSRRMGTDKARLALGGVTAVERVVAALSVAGPVVVVAAAGQPLPELGATVVRDEHPDTGPLHALALGLAAAAGLGAGSAVVSAVDQPLLHPAVVGALLARLGGHDVLLPVVQGHEQPLLAVYRTALATTAEHLVASGERRVKAVLAGAEVLRLDVDELLATEAVRRGDPGLRSFLGANTPQEWAVLERAVRERAVTRTPGVS